LQDQCGASNVFSIRGDEGLPLELRGANYPNYAMNVGHQGEYAGISQSAHAARGDAFVLNPLVKIAFCRPQPNIRLPRCKGRVCKRCTTRIRTSRRRALISPAK
jgi:methyl-coenzyme M reductase alpha subunit